MTATMSRRHECKVRQKFLPEEMKDLRHGLKHRQELALCSPSSLPTRLRSDPDFAERRSFEPSWHPGGDSSQDEPLGKQHDEPLLLP